MRLKVLGMPVPPKLPSCPFCQTPMRLVSILPRRAGQPKIRPFKCRLCRKEVTEIADDEEPSTRQPTEEDKARAYNRFDPQFWQNRANEVRATAAKIDAPDAKRMMFKIADTYDRRAKSPRGLGQSEEPAKSESLWPDTAAMHAI